MNDLQIFNNEEFGSIRTLTIDGDTWFVGRDIALALGYRDTSDALKRHVEEEDKQLFKVGETPTLKTSNYGAYIINESGMYCLILLLDSRSSIISIDRKSFKKLLNALSSA